MIIKEWEIPSVLVPEHNKRFLKIAFSPETTDTKELTILISIIFPENSSGLHAHDVNEWMYIVTGRGEYTEEGKSEYVIDEIIPGMIIYAPKNRKHNITNTGYEMLKMVCIYSPPLKPSGFFEKAVKERKKQVTKQYGKQKA
jgi:mannose-6-phosphate isomerase-like protein (cupin superfamily)